MKFIDLARTLLQIEQISARNEITQVLADMYKKLSPDEARVVSYLILGRIVPLFESLEFNISTKLVIRGIATLYKRPENEVVDLYDKLGDLGQVAFELNDKEVSDIDILEVFEKLTLIASDQGSGSVDRKIQKLGSLISQLDNTSSKFVIRIMLGDLRLGFSDMTLIDVLSFVISGDKSQRVVLENAFNVFGCTIVSTSTVFRDYAFMFFTDKLTTNNFDSK